MIIGGIHFCFVFIFLVMITKNWQKPQLQYDINAALTDCMASSRPQTIYTVFLKLHDFLTGQGAQTSESQLIA